jgi:hypothetical protein
MRRNTKTTPIFRSKLTPGGAGPFILQDGVPMAGSVDGFNNLWVVIAATAGGGNIGQLTVQPDNADNQAVRTTNDDLLTQARLFAYDAVGNNWDRVRSFGNNADALATNALGLAGGASYLFGFNTVTWDRVTVGIDSADGIATGIGHINALAHGLLFNGASWDRHRSASPANLASLLTLGAALVSLPGDWAINHVPVAATQATITRAASPGTGRHVCTSITAHLGAVAVNGTQILNLRDGTTGAGTILWSARLGPLVVGSSDHIELTGLNIVGSANTAMTLEFAAAPAATNFETVSMTGHDAT